MFNFTPNQKGRQSMPSSAFTAPVSEELQGNAAAASAETPANAAPTPYMEQRFAEVDAQRIAFEQKNPDFNMQEEMNNQDFINYLWGKELTVEEAYFLVHRDELLEQARNEGMEDLAVRRNRILENGAAKNRPAIAKKSPKDLSDKEVDAIIERARNGEKITF